MRTFYFVGGLMKKEKVLVFELGSSALRAMLAGRGLNNTFVVKAYKEIAYDGFYEGKFLEPEKLTTIFSQVISEFDCKEEDTKKVFIGVPAEFSSVSTTTVSLNLGNRRKVKQQDIDELFYMASEKAKDRNVEILSVSALSYLLDEGRASIDPVGENAISISANLSIIYANRTFIELFNKIVSANEFESVEYISEPLAQALYVVSKEEREEPCLIIDVGDLTTSASFVKGEGLSNMASFSRGGGFITNDLSEAFDLTISEAERLKAQIILSLKGRSNDYYDLTTDLGKTIKIPLSSANEIVSFRIEEIAQAVSKCVQLFSKSHINYLPVYLTGAGISKIKGGRDFLAKCLGRNVKYGVPPLPAKDKPELASIYSLVNSALGQ